MKTKKQPVKPIRLNPPETHYYATSDLRVFEIDDFTGDCGDELWTKDGLRFPKSDLSPTRDGCYRKLLDRLSSERSEVREKLAGIETSIERLNRERREAKS